MNLPSTVRCPESFVKSQWQAECPYCHNIVGFDGAVFWSWVTQGIQRVNPATHISPMDFDGVVERNFHYLVIETKDAGIKIPQGQEWTLNRLRAAKSFTIMRVWGKENPDKWEISMWVRSASIPLAHTSGEGYEAATEIVSKWYAYVDKH